MKKGLIILYLIISNIANSSAQIDKNFYCSIKEMHIGEKHPIYENSKDKIIKIYFEEYKIIDNHHIAELSGNDVTHDTISYQHPIEKVITDNDKKINAADFKTIEFSDFQKNDSYKTLCELDVDFIGDSKLDKIEITSSDDEQSGKDLFHIKLYENQNENQVICKNCSAIFWNKPLKLYVSKIKHLEMAALIFICEKEENEWIPKNSIKLEMIFADRIEN